MKLRCASFNVLADAYLGYGDYSHVDPSLLEPGARTAHILRVVENLSADVIGLQEAEMPLLEAIGATRKWRMLWSPKENGEPDGCLTLLRQGVYVEDFTTLAYPDNSGHIMQFMVIEGVPFSNTHIKWAPADDPYHAGIAQVKTLLKQLDTKDRAVILADCNDRPSGPVRALLANAGFANVDSSEPTAYINQELAALDIITTRGVRTKRIKLAFNPERIPSVHCPSDHIPVMAYIETA